LQWGVDRVLPLRTTLLRRFFTRESEDLSTATFRRGPLLEDSRRGVCWRAGFPGCCSPLVVCCFPPCGVFPPAVCGGYAPLPSFDPARSFAFMGPPGELSGIATPDLGWQQSGRRGRAAAARISTSAETPADTQASQHQRCLDVFLFF